jgi:hypothetical protein
VTSAIPAAYLTPPKGDRCAILRAVIFTFGHCFLATGSQAATLANHFVGLSGEYGMARGAGVEYTAIFSEPLRGRPRPYLPAVGVNAIVRQSHVGRSTEAAYAETGIRGLYYFPANRGEPFDFYFGGGMAAVIPISGSMQRSPGLFEYLNADIAAGLQAKWWSYCRPRGEIALNGRALFLFRLGFSFPMPLPSPGR